MQYDPGSNMERILRWFRTCDQQCCNINRKIKNWTLHVPESVNICVSNNYQFHLLQMQGLLRLALGFLGFPCDCLGCAWPSLGLPGIAFACLGLPGFASGLLGLAWVCLGSACVGKPAGDFQLNLLL